MRKSLVVFVALLVLQVSSRRLVSITRMMATKEVTIGAGCFWGPQKTFDKMTGVVETKVGYTGGNNPSPTYSSVCAGDGHIEAVKIVYDDEVTTFDKILDIFFERDLRAFESGLGQYQNVIWVANDEEKAIAEARKEKLVQSNDPRANLFSIRQKYNEKQFPRIILLVIAGICDVTPGLPQEVYKFGLGLVSDSPLSFYSPFWSYILTSFMFPQTPLTHCLTPNLTHPIRRYFIW